MNSRRRIHPLLSWASWADYLGLHQQFQRDSKADGVGVLRLIVTLVVYQAPSSAFRKDHKFHLIAHLLQEAR